MWRRSVRVRYPGRQTPTPAHWYRARPAGEALAWLSFSGDCCIDLGQALFLRYLAVTRGNAIAKRVEAVPHAADPGKQLGVDEGRDGFAILVDDNAVVPVLDLIQHLAKVLAAGWGLADLAVTRATELRWLAAAFRMGVELLNVR